MRRHRDCCVPEQILAVFQFLTAGTETHRCPLFPCDLFVSPSHLTIVQRSVVSSFRFRSVCFTLFLVPAIRDVLLCHFPHYLAFRHDTAICLPTCDFPDVCCSRDFQRPRHGFSAFLPFFVKHVLISDNTLLLILH